MLNISHHFYKYKLKQREVTSEEADSGPECVQSGQGVQQYNTAEWTGDISDHSPLRGWAVSCPLSSPHTGRFVSHNSQYYFEQRSEGIVEFILVI